MKKIFIIIVLVSLYINLFAAENYEPGVILLKVKDPNNVRINNTKVINGSYIITS